MPAEYVPTADQRALVENAAAFGRPQWRQRAVSRLPSQPSSAVTSDRVSTSIFAVSLSEAESRSVLDERPLDIFGWYFPFRVAQLRDARARRENGLGTDDKVRRDF